LDINAIGKLEYNDDCEFELHMDNGVIINITNILDDIYSPTSLKDSQVWVKIMKGEVILFDEDGALTRRVDKDGIESYFICGNNLDLEMFDHTEEFLEIVIKRGNMLKNGKIS